MKRDGQKPNWREFVIGTLIEDGVEAVVGFAWRRIEDHLTERERYASGQAYRDFRDRMEERIDAVLFDDEEAEPDPGPLERRVRVSLRR